MNQAERLLIHALAASDAALAPQRQWEPRRVGAILYVRRQELAAQGVCLRRQTASRTLRQHLARVLAELHAAAYIASKAVSGSKFLYVRLTDAGDQFARHLTGLPGIDCAAELTREIHRQRRKARPDGWLAEIHLADAAADLEAELQAVELMAAPALVRGWLESHSDLRGNAYYRLTAAGLVIIGRKATRPPAIVNPPAEQPDAKRLYFEQLAAADANRQQPDDRREKREIGRCALSVSV